MENNFKFIVSSEYTLGECDFLYTAFREKDEEEFLITWEDEGELYDALYPSEIVEEYLNDGSWIIQ